MWNEYGKYGQSSLRTCKNGSFQRKRVMVVDDNITNLHVVKGLLSIYDVETDLVESGRECLDKMAEVDYQIVFLDYSMPGMNGMETFLEIQKMQLLKISKTSVIALTANETDGMKEKFIHAGFCDFIPKPVSITELERVLMKYLPGEMFYPNGQNGNTDKWDVNYNWLMLTEGVHFWEGMQNYGNDREQYLNILGFFYEDAEAHINRMKQFLLKKNYSLFLFEIHALKGLAGGIGAKELSYMAGELEHAVKEHNIEFVERNASQVLERYEQIRIGVEGVLYKMGRLEKETECKGQITKNEIIDALLYILQKNSLLEQNLAEEATKNLLSYSISDNLRKMLNCVKSEIDNFEYKKANDLLIKLVEEMKSEIGANNE